MVQFSVAFLSFLRSCNLKQGFDCEILSLRSALGPVISGPSYYLLRGDRSYYHEYPRLSGFAARLRARCCFPLLESDATFKTGATLMGPAKLGCSRPSRQPSSQGRASVFSPLPEQIKSGTLDQYPQQPCRWRRRDSHLFSMFDEGRLSPLPSEPRNQLFLNV